MLRASEFYRVRHCLASVRMSEEVKGTPQEAPNDPIAEQGTEEHAGFAAGDDSYQQYLAKKELETWADGHKYQVFNEQELYLRHEWLEPYFVGHPDRYAIRDDGAVAVIDFKTGPLLEIDAWDDQVNCYLVTILETHGDRLKGPWTLLVISKYHGVFRITPCSPNNLKELIKTAVSDCRSPALLPTAGRWCRYCPARLVCPEAPRAIEPLITGKELPLGEDGAELLTRLHILKKLVSEKIKYYEDLVRKDEKILAGRWKVGKGKRTGEITSLTKALPSLSLFIDTRPALEASAKLSYAKMRDFVAETKGLTKKDAEAALIDILGDLLVFKEGEGSVVETVPEQITDA